jgi:hemerythrin
MFISRLKSLQQKVTSNPVPQPPFAAWTSRMSVQVKLLDNDHKKLLILLSELHDGVTLCYARQFLDMILENLICASRAHFAHEEQLFTETAFPGATVHEREHDHIIERLKVLQVRFRNCADTESSLKVVQLLKNCLFNHIEISDQEYVPHLTAKEVFAMLAASEAPPSVGFRKQAIGSRILQGAW